MKDTELFMMAQFIDVMDVLSKHTKIEEVKKEIQNRKKNYLEYINKLSSSQNFETLNLYDETIDNKIEQCSQIYSNNKEYKEILEKLEIKYEDLYEKLEEKNKKELDEIRGLIYQACDFDMHLAYKIGLIDGIKVKNKCT